MPCIFKSLNVFPDKLSKSENNKFDPWKTFHINNKQRKIGKVVIPCVGLSLMDVLHFILLINLRLVMESQVNIVSQR